MKQKILFLVLLLLGAAMAMQAQEFTTLVVLMKDGSTTKIKLDQQPEMSFSGNVLNVKTSAIELGLDRTKIRNFTFTDGSGIESVTTTEANKFRQLGDLLVFENLPVNSNVRVFGIDGRLMRQLKAVGSCELSLSELSAGVYIVNVNGVSTKIIIRR